MFDRGRMPAMQVNIAGTSILEESRVREKLAQQDSIMQKKLGRRSGNIHD